MNSTKNMSQKAAELVPEVGGWSWDVERQTLSWTAEAYHMHGFNPEDGTPGTLELLNRSLGCYHPEDRANVFSALKNCSDNGVPYDLEFRLTQPNGRKLWVRMTGIPVFNDRKVSRVVGNIADITDRKNREITLREDEKKLRSILENNHGIITIIQDGTVTFINKRATEISGYGESEFLSTPFLYHVHPEDREMFLEQTQDKPGGEGLKNNFQFRFVTKEGDIRWLENKWVPTVFEDRPATLNFLTDVTGRKQFEEALINAKQQWQETFDAVTDWVSIIDADHNLLRSNLSSDKFLHLSAKQILGNKCYNVVHDTDAPVPDCPLRRAVKSNKREEMEIQLADGRWIHVSVDPIKHVKYGNLYVHIVRDISRQKVIEKQIIAAKKAEAFSVLSGGIAHDFNNLLAVIWGSISMLREEISNGDQQDLCRMAETACEQAKSLTHQFIMLSKGFALQKSLYPIADILRSGIEWVPVIHGIKITLDIPEPSPTVELDFELFVIALKNILSNAIEAMSDGGKLHISVRTIPGQPENSGHLDYLQISFKDTGKGISQSDLADVYDPYFTTKTFGTSRGSGLGLAVSRSIVKKHDGEIKIESKPDDGTTVKIILPLTEQNPEKMMQAKTLPRLGKNNTYSSGKRAIPGHTEDRKIS